MTARRTAKGRSRLLVLILAAAVAIVLIPLAGWFGVRWWRASNVAEIRVKAFALYDEGRFEEALAPLSRVVARDADKKDVEALRRLAKARFMVPAENRAHIPQSAKFYAAAIAADPTDVESHRELLKLRRMMGQLVEAESLAEALLKLDPSDSTAALMLVQIKVTKGDVEGAQRMVEERVRLHPNDIEAKLRLWRFWMDGSRPAEECLVEIDRWLEEPNPDPVLRVIRAERLRSAGRTDEVQAEIAKLQDAQPTTVASCRVVARALGRMSRQAEANQLLASSAKRLGGTARGELALELFNEGWLTDRLDTADEALEIAKEDPTARWVGRGRITVAFLRGDPASLEAAIAAHRPSGVTATADVDFGAALSLALETLKNPSSMAKANAAVERALISNPKDPILLYAQAAMRMAAGDRGSAIASGAEAFEATGNAWVRVGLMLIPMVEAYGDRARAKELLDRLAETQIGQPQVQTMLVLASADSVARGESPVIPDQDFRRLCRTLQQQAETAPELTPLAVLSLLTIDDERRAKALIDRCLKNEAVPGPVFLELARIVRRSGTDKIDGGEALLSTLLSTAATRGVPAVQIESFRAATGEVERSLPALLSLADAGDLQALRTAGELADVQFPDQAPAILERLLDKDRSPETLAFVLNSQSALRNPALLEKAIAAAEAVEGGRGDGTAIARARLLLAKGKPERAQLDATLAELDDIRQRRGETVELLATMASLLLASDPPDLTAASRLAGKAATLAPDRAQLQLLATGLFRQSGNADSATLYLQKAMATPAAKTDPMIRRGIIEELRISGQHKVAAEEARQLATDTGASADWILAADLSQLADDIGELEKCLRAAVAASDAMPAAWSRLAIGLGRAGRVADARAVLEELKTKQPEAIWLPIVVDFELNFSPPEVAVAQLDAAIAKYPDEPILMLNKARERIARQDPQAALAIADRASKSDATRIAAREIALQLVGAPDPVGAQAIEALAAAGGVAAEPLRQLRSMRDGAAAASGSQALELARKVPTLWTVWAFALDVANAANDPGNRLVIAEEAVRNMPNDPRALAAYSSILLDAGRPGEARDIADRLRIISSAAPEYRGQAVRLMAMAQLGLGQAPRAKEMLVGYADQSGDQDSGMLAAAIDAQLGKVADGYRRAGPIVAKSDPALLFWLRLVGTLSPKDALALLEAAAPHEARMPNLFASAWIMASGRDNPAGLDRAAKLLEAARTGGKSGLENLAVNFELAVIRDDRAAIELARAALANEFSPVGRDIFQGKAPTATVTDPKDLQAADSAFTEAKALLERGRELERAQKLVEAAIAAQGNLDQRITLARVLAARGQADAALELATRLSRHYPSSPDVWLALARAKLAQRDRDGALIAVEEGKKAVSMSFFVAPKVKAELDAMAGAVAALSGSR